VSIAIEQQREVLRQAGVALAGRVVTLWEVFPTTDVAPLASSVPDPPIRATALDLDATLRQWGAPIIVGSRWVGCSLDDSGRWCVAPVRSRPPGPPPGGVERRSRERLILELAGLCLGALDATGPSRRLPPAEAAREHARQPSVIAHEVGNHLAVALGNLELGILAVRSEPSVDGAFRARLLDDLGNAAAGIEQATQYLRSIQDRSVEAVGRESRFDLIPVVRACVTLERPLAHKHGVELQWETAIDSVFVSGDPNALYQVVMNLIRNAVDASRQLKEPVQVTLAQRGEMLTVTVQDRGVGIPPQHLAQVFVAGFTTKPAGEGSGMGLAVVREITEHMFGGTVQVASEPGAGSTFTLLLPIPKQRAGEE
jgi:signal transduction histidine kinase